MSNSEINPLEALGFSKEEIAERIITQAVAQLLRATDEDEDGIEYGVPSTFASRIDKVIREKIDAAVVKAGDEIIAPRISELVSGHVIQQTNAWGEKRGEAVSFTEYLVQRAEAYMTEQVNYEGKAKSENSSFSWSAKTTRVAYMIDKHLHYAIETAMEKALQNANNAVCQGLNEAVRTAIANLTVNVKTEVKS